MEFKVGKGESTKTIDIDLDKVMRNTPIVEYLVGYALAVIAQRANAGKGDAEGMKTGERRLRDLEAGNLPAQGGGGSPKPLVERYFDETIMANLQSAGFKKKDARKLVADGQALVALAKVKLAKAGKEASRKALEETEDKLEEAFKDAARKQAEIAESIDA